jgi:hypothetical protein
MAQKYTIHLDYQTGDTNGSYDAETDVGEWSNLDMAKASLARIQEHNDWFRCKKDGFCWHHYNDKCPPQPEWHKNMTLPQYANESQRAYCVELLDDDGKPFSMMAYTWCGYFERLLGGRVSLVEGSDGMSFKV